MTDYASGDDCHEEYDWGSLVPMIAHPIRVAIIEIMFFLEIKLSASDLRELFCGEVPLSNVHYHLSMLKKADVVAKADQRQVGGTTETFFALR